MHFSVTKSQPLRRFSAILTGIATVGSESSKCTV